MGPHGSTRRPVSSYMADSRATGLASQSQAQILMAPSGHGMLYTPPVLGPNPDAPFNDMGRYPSLESPESKIH